MTKNDSFILVHLLEKRPPGDRFARTRSAWPLHITLIPWFSVASNHSAELIADIEQYTWTASQLKVVVGQEEMFGPRSDVPVNVIKDQSLVRKLHDDLLKIVNANDTSFHQGASPKSGVEQGYEAHITHHFVDGTVHRRYPGDVVDLDEVTLASLHDGPSGQVCEIVKTFKLVG